MKELERRRSSNEQVLITLQDFIPDVSGVLANAGKKELKQCLKNYPLFAKFVDLVNEKKHKRKH